MRKRRRLMTTPMKNKVKINRDSISKDESEAKDIEVSTARGRLKGALLDALDPAGDESDASSDHSPSKRERNSQDYSRRDYQSEDDDKYKRKPSPPRQSYVLKLFDRSVDLSQFSEHSPLYPICRAWIANQPKANYKDFGKKDEGPGPDESMELPGPEGPPVPRVPDLLPEQKETSKHNIDLDYQSPPPSREELLGPLLARWGRVRRAWLSQSAAMEQRYQKTQDVLNNINASIQ